MTELFLAFFWYLLALVAIVYAGMMLLWNFGWGLISVTSAANYLGKTKVTVLIPARNEGKNIVACLTAIETQNYSPELVEIIVVDDASEDNTSSLIREFIQNYPHRSIQLITIDKEQAVSKKQAIEKGIAQATGQLLVSTDADCIAPPLWLTSIVQKYETTGAKMILGPVRYAENAGLFAGMQALEFLGLIGITGASARWNVPLMANGANLAYERSAYEEVGGFTGNDTVASGDDVFLMLKLHQAQPGSVHFLKSYDAVVTTKAADGLKSFWNQRLRWASKGKHYQKGWVKGSGILVFLLNILLLVGGVLALMLEGQSFWLFFAFGLKVSMDFFFLLSVTSYFRQSKLMPLWLLVEVLSLVYVPVVALGSTFLKYRWKGREAR